MDRLTPIGRIGFFVLLLAVALGTAAAAQAGLDTPKAYGLAIKGYDPVAYFTIGKAVRGDSKHRTTWNEAIWQFTSAEHLALFEADPSKYAPRHTGYCAVSLLAGRDAAEDPEKWKIVDGKLYLGWSAAKEQ